MSWTTNELPDLGMYENEKTIKFFMMTHKSIFSDTSKFQYSMTAETFIRLKLILFLSRKYL